MAFLPHSVLVRTLKKTVVLLDERLMLLLKDAFQTFEEELPDGDDSG